MNASEQGPESEEEREYALFLRWWHEGHKDYWGNPFQAAWQAWRERSARKEPQER